MIPLSVLDLVPVRVGSTAGEAIREAVDLARTAERLGYVRYWFAEHHSMGICAPTGEEADYLATSTDLGWVRLHRKEFAPVPSPEEASRYQYNAQERVIVEANRPRHFIGTPSKVANLIRHAVEDTQADEIMVTTMIHGREERQRSYELLAAEWGMPS